MFKGYNSERKLHPYRVDCLPSVYTIYLSLFKHTPRPNKRPEMNK